MLDDVERMSKPLLGKLFDDDSRMINVGNMLMSLRKRCVWRHARVLSHRSAEAISGRSRCTAIVVEQSPEALLAMGSVALRS
jgi:hypothetical protein